VFIIYGTAYAKFLTVTNLNYCRNYVPSIENTTDLVQKQGER